MKIGVVGIGKVGLPLAQALSVVPPDKPHQVLGLDINLDSVLERYASDTLPGELVPLTSDYSMLVAMTDVIFVVVQTPHDPEYGGEQPMPEKAKDFDYSYLITAINGINLHAKVLGKEPIVVIVSTVLPGTIDREIKPIADHLRLVYSPVFISLGTVLADLINPSIVLIGTDDHEAGEEVIEALRPLYRNQKSIHWCDFASAEIVKMAHNVRLSSEIVLVNLLSEICSEVGGDIDAVTGAMERIPHFLPQAGMGDGGACRPRDVIALSWLVEQKHLSSDIFRYLAEARELHSLNLALEVSKWADMGELPICIMGVAYKPWVSYTDGSPALLLAFQLNDLGHVVKLFDPHVPDYMDTKPHSGPHVYVIATKHPEFQEMRFIEGSVVIDPWGFWVAHDGVQHVTPGRTQKS